MSQLENEGAAGSGEMSAREFAEKLEEWHREKHMAGLRHGPCYAPGESAPLLWHDQVFERGITPSGTVICGEALRVGNTQNGLDVILVGSHANSGPVTAASGATITLYTLQADSPRGTFEEVGPSICLKAPTEGISADRDHLLARIPLGNFRKPWLKVKLEFSGTISGGLVDAALSYAGR